MIKKILLLSLLIFNLELFAVSETQIKAVFLEKFTHLIQWPGTADDSFIVCVINDKKFANALEEIYKKKQFNNRPVVVISIEEDEDIPNCQLLYFGQGTKKAKKIIKKLENRAVLTVSDQEEYISENIMIIIFLKQKRFKYIINNKAAKDANMKISYLLLKSAQEVIQ